MSANGRVAALPPGAYCTVYEQAVTSVAQIKTGAGGGMIGLDIETCPSEAEASRLAQLLDDEVKLKGKTKAAKKCGAGAAELAALKTQAKLLATRVRYAKSAGLDPHRGRIRLVQLYAGGNHVLVIDVFKCGERALQLLDGLDVVVHNAAFELAWLEHAGVELGEVHCSLQGARLTLGERSTSLADAAQAYLEVALDKTEQVSDWSAPELSRAQLEYAALDAVMAYRLAVPIFKALDVQTSAYEIQIACVPAVARMGLRGVRLDREAHAEYIRAQEGKRDAAASAYMTACANKGLPTTVPITPDQKRSVLKAILSGEEIKNWARTKKTGELSTGRNELKRAAHYPPIQALVELSRVDKILTSFGATLAAFVSPVTGCVHAGYRVAATAAGRASCSKPNVQQMPRDKAFRALFRPEPGCVFVGADFSSMELRAAAYISGCRDMTAAFRDGLDLHRLTAARMLGKPVEEIAEDGPERAAAKPVNFGAIYGIGAASLARSAWDHYDIVITLEEAIIWIAAFKRAYPEYIQWRWRHHRHCEETGRVVIGRDMKKGVGRLFPLSRVPEGKSTFTRCCNLPVQGACADASMTALTNIDRLLYEGNIDGGPVLWLHDEIILEVPSQDAQHAKLLLEKVMCDAFEETFPGSRELGLLNGLVEAHIGQDWSAVKGKKKEETAELSV
jgi:DNA polymerase-1